ncbi:MAG: hypothetical protein OHK0029_05080 [Armatimonadaceae bacterium]
MPKPRTPEPSRPPRRHRWLFRFSILNLIAFLLIYAAAEFVAEDHWFTTGLVYAPPLLFAIPALLFLLIALLRRNRRAISVNLVATLAALPFLGFQWHPLPVSTDSPKLRVLTFNILHGVDGVPEIVEVLKDADADIICLQEAKILPKRANDPLPELKEALPEYEFVRAGDVAIASRLPVLETREFPMPYSARKGLVMDVYWKGSTVTVTGVHFSSAAGISSLWKSRRRLPAYMDNAARMRRHHAGALLRETREIKTPLIVLGDFNTPPRGKIYDSLTERWQDAFAATGNGFGWTFPAVFPVLRIDHVFTGNGARAVRAEQIEVNCSDHDAMLAEVVISPARNR